MKITPEPPMPTKRKPAKRPAAAPEKLWAVIDKDGEKWIAATKRTWAVADMDYYAHHYKESAPFRIVKYRLDQPPRGAARR